MTTESFIESLTAEQKAGGNQQIENSSISSVISHLKFEA
jgi:hypothetical protein